MILLWQSQTEPGGSGAVVHVVELPREAHRSGVEQVLAGTTDGFAVAWVPGQIIWETEEAVRLTFAAWCERFLQGRSRKTQEARWLAMALGWVPARPRKGDLR